MKNDLMQALVLGLMMLGGSAAVAAPPPPEIKDANKEVDAYLADKMPLYRIAGPGDYAPALKGKDQGEPLIKADFNQDGQMDYAVLLVSESGKKSAVYYLLGHNGDFKPVLLVSRKWTAPAAAKQVTTPMFFKPAGAPGLSERAYNELTQDSQAPAKLSLAERQALHKQKAAFYVSVPALEVWIGQNKSSGDTLDDIAYCSRTWYYQGGVLKAFNACD